MVAPRDTSWLEEGLVQFRQSGDSLMLAGEAMASWLPDSLLGARGKPGLPVSFWGRDLAYAEMQKVYWQDEPMWLLRLADYAYDPDGLRALYGAYCAQEGPGLPVTTQGDFAWIGTDPRQGQLTLEAGLGYRFHLQLAGASPLDSARLRQAWLELRRAWEARSGIH
jgi:hypothetical protein